MSFFADANCAGSACIISLSMQSQNVSQAAPLASQDARNNPPLDLRRNKLAFGGDSMFWGIGTYFIPLTTVITALAAQLTTDKSLIGLISLAWYVAYLLPQLFAARLVHGKRRTMLYSVVPAIIGRQTLLVFALWLFLTQAQQPTLTVWILIVLIAVLMIFDAFTSQAWFDMFGRALTPRAKARVITVNQLLASVGGIGAGLIVTQVLSSPALPFPTNYALLFFFAWIFIMLSLGAMLFIRERVSEAPPAEETTHSNFNAKLLEAWRSDAAFRRMLLARVFTGVENMAAAFYIVFALEKLGLPESSIGIFTIAVVLGGLLGIIFFGWLADRYGSRRVVNAACTLQFIAPLITLGVALLPIQSKEFALVAITLVMAINGAVNRSMMVGFFSYAQDSAPEADRPIYVGAVSTVAGTASLLPLLGGVMINAFTSAGMSGLAYVVLFAVAAGVAAIGAWISYGLPKPRNA
jgi:MFS family permease